MIEIASRYLRAPRTLWMAGLLAVGCVTLQAQPDGGPPGGGPPPDDMQPQQSQGPSAKGELKQLTRQLTLTADQQTQVKALLAEQQQQIEALFKQSRPAADSDNGAGGPPSPEAMSALRDKMKTIREATYEKIGALLSADQQSKFAAWREKQEKAQEQQGDDMPPPPPDGGGPPDSGGGPPGGGSPGGGGPPGV